MRDCYGGRDVGHEAVHLFSYHRVGYSRIIEIHHNLVLQSLLTSLRVLYSQQFRVSRRLRNEEAAGPRFETLDWLDERLVENRYLLGDAVTEADWRLFPTRPALLVVIVMPC